jgi:hypothetical protein
MEVFTLELVWIPRELGGHRAAPWQGMRATIRWQRYLAESLELARDVECVSLSFDETTNRAVGTFELSSAEPLPSGWLSEGSLIELLDGYRVIAVGRVAAGSPRE